MTASVYLDDLREAAGAVLLRVVVGRVVIDVTVE